MKLHYIAISTVEKVEANWRNIVKRLFITNEGDLFSQY